MHIKPTLSGVQASKLADISDPLLQLAQLGKPGSLLTAVVEHSAARPGQQASQRLFDVLLNIGGQRIETSSSKPFQPGQLLKVEILSSNALKVLEVIRNATAPAIDPIVAGLRQALPAQQEQSLLLANLRPYAAILNLSFAQPAGDLPATPAQLPATPPQNADVPGQKQASQMNPLPERAIHQLNQLLQSLPNAVQIRHPALLKNAIQNSGSFLEAKLAKTLQQLQTTQGTARSPVGSATKPTPGDPNTIPIREALNSKPLVAQQVQKVLNQDFKAQILKLAKDIAPLISQQARALPADTGNPATAQIISRILQASASTTTSSATAASQPTQQPASMPRLVDTPINFQLLAVMHNLAQQRPQPGTAGKEDALDLATSTLLRQIAASIAKIQANQFNSLAAQQGGTDGPIVNSWIAEVPVFHEGQLRLVQLQIDEEAARDAKEQGEKGRQWNITLGFEFETLGEFFATLKIAGHRVSATFWSERQATLSRISRDLEMLKSALNGLGLEVKQLQCKQGTPPIRQTRLEQRLVDIKT